VGKQTDVLRRVSVFSNELFCFPKGNYENNPKYAKKSLLACEMSLVKKSNMDKYVVILMGYHKKRNNGMEAAKNDVAVVVFQIVKAICLNRR
jgi:hypothetical protein